MEITIDFTPVKPIHERGDCPRCGGAAQEWHSCPYSIFGSTLFFMELAGDCETECNCCVSCENACGEDT